MTNPHADKIAAHLARVAPFDTLSPLQLRALSRSIRIDRFAEGDQILRRGAPGHEMYIIASGHVSVPVRENSGTLKFEAHLPPGQCLGELALLTGSPRSADAFASTQCMLLAVPRDAVLALLDSAPHVAAYLTELLGDRLLENDGIRTVGQYSLFRRIGRGGMSLVFEGRQRSLDRPVAVKMLSHQLVYRRNFAERFRNEAKIIAGLRHPHIVQVFDMVEAYATFFIVMEMLEGEDLSRIIKHKPMAPAEVRRILGQVARALEYAHSLGVIHRDLKPSNVRVLPDGSSKLMDFGLAWVQRFENSLVEDEDIVLGTPYYMSPEQAQGLELDHRTDIYNFGVLAFEMLTGERPFAGQSKSEVQRRHVEDAPPDPRSMVDSVPTDLLELIDKCMKKDPADRFSSCGEIVAFLSAKGTTGRLHVENFRVMYEVGAADDVEHAISELRQAIALIPGAEFGGSL
ncbi:MAG: CRP-like cAMP-binding protein [Bradymonadia bacterium]|jgi:CRP-like cAMP-binding protein